jgi:hypothetical protein
MRRLAASQGMMNRHRLALDRLVTTEPYTGVQAMNTTWFEKGIERGRRETLREQLEERFGPLPPRALERLEQLPVERLIALGKAVLQAPLLRALGLEDEAG